MSDQADNLRQLVEARRLWRELAPEGRPPPVVWPEPARREPSVGGGDGDAPPRRLGRAVASLLARAARRTLGRGLP